MRKWLVLMLILAAALAACGGDKEEPAATTAPTATAQVVDESTEEPFDGLPGNVLTPGIRAVDSVQVVASNSYTNNAGGWIVLEVENISGEILPNVQLSASLLDSQNRELDTQTTISPFLNIPPGYVVPVLLSFLAPPDYSNYFALLEVERQTGAEANFIGEFDLPATVNQPDNVQFPLTITGSIHNDRGETLITPVAAVTVFDTAGNLLGTALAALDGHTDRGEWLADTDLTFQASFQFLPSTDFGEIRVRSAGYRIQ